MSDQDYFPAAAPPPNGDSESTPDNTPNTHLAVVLAPRESLRATLEALCFSGLYLVGASLPEGYERPEPGAPDPDPSPEAKLAGEVNKLLTNHPAYTTIHVLNLGGGLDASLVCAKIVAGGRNVARLTPADLEAARNYFRLYVGLEEAQWEDFDLPDELPDEDKYEDPPVELPDGFAALSHDEFVNLRHVVHVEIDRDASAIHVTMVSGEYHTIHEEDATTFLATFLRPRK